MEPSLFEFMMPALVAFWTTIVYRKLSRARWLDNAARHTEEAKSAQETKARRHEDVIRGPVVLGAGVVRELIGLGIEPTSAIHLAKGPPPAAIGFAETRYQVGRRGVLFQRTFEGSLSKLQVRDAVTCDILWTGYLDDYNRLAEEAARPTWERPTAAFLRDGPAKRWARYYEEAMEELDRLIPTEEAVV
jgi:hypothetical protein